MRAAPRTDAAAREGVAAVYETSRQLEHELAVAREWSSRLADAGDGLRASLAEAREDLEAVKREVQRLRIVNQALDESTELTEARAALGRLVDALIQIKHCDDPALPASDDGPELFRRLRFAVNTATHILATIRWGVAE